MMVKQRPFCHIRTASFTAFAFFDGRVAFIPAAEGSRQERYRSTTLRQNSS